MQAQPLTSSINLKSIYEERYKRYEIANTELTTALDELQSRLLEAKSEGAKNLADAIYHKEKCIRLEESLGRCRGEIAQLNKNRAEIQETVASVENALSKATAAQGRLESENRSYESKLRLFETRLETEKATAARYAQDNGQLRDDISRQGAMIDHIRRIENSLSAKNQTDMTALRDQLSAATEKIVAMDTKNSSEISELSNKLSDSQGKVETLQISSAKHQKECLEAKKESLQAKTELQSAKSQIRKLETQLRAVKRKLGEDDEVDNIELDLQQKIDSLESELAKAKNDIDGLQEELENYRGIAKSGESELSKTKKAAESFKSELQEEMNDLKKQMEQRNKEFELRSGLIQDLTVDLAGQRDEREKIEQSLKAEIQSLKDKIASDEALVSSTKASFDSYKADIQRYQEEVADAQQNYERELAKHAEARTAVRSAQEAMVEHQHLRETAVGELKTLQDEVATTKETFESERAKLKSQITALETRVEEARGQNKLLHSQLDSMNSAIDKSKQTVNANQDSESEDNDQQKTISELQEIIKYLRSENEISQTDLDAAKRAVDREKASTGVLRRSLEELRAELQTVRQEASNGDSQSSTEELLLRLEDKNHQLRVLNDSNRLLREDAERLTQKLKRIEAELASAKTETQPIGDIKKDLDSKIATLESENASLRRELDSWKSRMSNLVKNLDQIDPEEHRKLATQVQEMTKEKDSLNAWKTATEDENKRMRLIANRLKKLSEEHQATIQKQKQEISALQSEKENLKKASTTTSALLKERNDLKAKVSHVEKEKTAIKTELEGANKNSDRLRESLRRFKDKIVSLEQELANTKAIASEAKLQKRSSTEEAPKVMNNPNTGSEKIETKTPPKTGTPAAGQASTFVPKIPEEGFKFGPSTTKAPPVKSDTSKESLSKPSLEGKEQTKVPETKGEVEKPKRRLSGETKLMTMKEKLLMRKKKLEQEMQEGLKRKQSLDEPESASKRPKTDDVDVIATDVSKTAAKANVEIEETKIEDTNETSDGSDKQPVTEDVDVVPNETSKGDTTDNEDDEVAIEADDPANASDVATTSDAPSSGVSDKGLRPSATPFAPSLGAPSSSAPLGSISSPFGKSGDGAFLSNMKPPGKSGPTPTFSFGSKSNITLPTPTVPQSPAPFGVEFGRTASSSNLGAAKPLFGDTPVEDETKDEPPADESEE